MALTDELADIALTRIPHLRGAGIADVRVVRPDHDLRHLQTPAQMCNERVQRVGTPGPASSYQSATA